MDAGFLGGDFFVVVGDNDEEAGGFRVGLGCELWVSRFRVVWDPRVRQRGRLA